jgi:Protein of unknown function (DUF3987)/BT4734-like, N-terminal domain
MSPWANTRPPQLTRHDLMAVVISKVQCATDVETRDINVEKVFEAIRTGGKNLKGQIQQIRNRFEAEMAFSSDPKKAKLAVDPLKKQLPGVLWSGTFSQRANDKLMKYSRLLCADLDSLGADLVDVRKKLEASPHTVAVFLSPSGDGLKALFIGEEDASRHPATVRAVEKHVRDLTGKQIDQACKDPARLCFMSHDPQLYINPRATQIEPLPEPEKRKRPQTTGEIDLLIRERIAGSKVGAIERAGAGKPAGSYYCTCPFQDLHTTGNGPHDTMVYLLPNDQCEASTIYCVHNSCRAGLGELNHDLRSEIWKAEKQRNGQNAAPSTRSHVLESNFVDVDEPEMELPPAPVPYVPPPLEIFSPVLRDYVQAWAETLNVDVAYICNPILSSIGAAIGNSRVIRLKKGFCQPPIFWTGNVGRSGFLKTPAIEKGTHAIREREEELKRLNKQAREIYEEEIADWNHAPGKTRGSKPQPPTKRTVRTGNLTIESLLYLLDNNPRGVLGVNDELAGLIEGVNQYKGGKGSDVSVYLELHNGSYVSWNRRTDDLHYRIPHPRVNLAGGIQPATLKKVMTEDFFLRGFPARFLFVHPPERPNKWTEATVPDEVIAATLRLFDELWLLAPEADAEGNVMPVELPLSPGAREIYIDFYNSCGEEIFGSNEHEGAAWAKLSGYGARLALLSQLVWEPQSQQIAAERMEAACAYARWSGNETKRIYAELSETEEQRDRRGLIEFIRKRGGSVTVRDTMQSFTRLKNDRDGAERELYALVKNGLAKTHESKPAKGGWKTVIFQLLQVSTSTLDLRNTNEKAPASVDVDAA